MHSAAPAPEPPPVIFEWNDAPLGRIAVACRFPVDRLRHVVEGHFDSLSEPWDRLLPRALIDRLVERSRQGPGWLPDGDDHADFVRTIAAAMHECCRRPMLCVCFERVLAIRRNGTMRPERGARSMATVLFVLRCGASIFVKLDRDPTADCPQVSGEFATCYFKRGRLWHSAHRAYADAAWRFVSQWAEHRDRGGNRILPRESDRVISQRGDRMMERKGIRFVTPETWGFCPTAEGTFVFQGAPTWKP